MCNVNYRLKIELQLTLTDRITTSKISKKGHHTSSIHLEGYISKMHTIAMFNFITQNAYSQIK